MAKLDEAAKVVEDYLREAVAGGLKTSNPLEFLRSRGVADAEQLEAYSLELQALRERLSREGAPGLETIAAQLKAQAIKAGTAGPSGAIMTGEGAGQTPSELADGLLNEAMSGVTMMGEALGAQAPSSAEEPALVDRNPLAECFVSPMMDPSEAKVATLAAQALREAGRRTGRKELEDPRIAASVATSTVVATKVAYKVAKGEMTEEEAERHLEVALTAIILRALEVGLPMIGGALGTWLGNPGLGVMLAEVIVRVAGPAVAPFVARGLARVATWIKKTFVKVVDLIKTKLFPKTVVVG